MTEYGNPSRVSVNMSGGGIVAISGGEERKAIVFARGDSASGSANANEPTRVSGPGELDSTFGEGTPIVNQIKRTAANGVSYSMIWGVMPTETEVVDEDITGGADAVDHTGGSKIANIPIIEDETLITVLDDTGTELTPVFKYETNTDSTNSDFTALTPGADEFFVNKNTGEWVADTADNYSITYNHLDWQKAFESATEVVKEQELGKWIIDTESEDVINNATTVVDPLRTSQWKMITTVGAAEPNQTGDDGGAEINVTDYTDGIDHGASFLFTPTRADGEVTTLAGAIGGVMAGNSITNPIIGDTLTGVTELEQTLNVADQETAEEAQLIPLSNSGAPTIEGNLSSSTASDWLRSYFSRDIGDRLILGARAVAKATRGKLNNENTETIVEQQIADEIVDMIEQGVLRPNTEDENRWFVNAEQDETNSRKLDVSFGFTPSGVVDIVNVDATINY